MLDCCGKRKLAYVVKVEEVCPILGYDNIVFARVCNWWTVVKKDEFKVGDWGIYFENDSVIPPDNKVIRAKKFGHVYSEGLLQRVETFSKQDNPPAWALSLQWRINNNKQDYFLFEDLTDVIGVIHVDDIDSESEEEEPPQSFLQKLFPKRQNQPFPTQFKYVEITNQERCENIPNLLNDKTPYIVTEKCDGTSATYILDKKKKFYICSHKKLNPIDPVFKQMAEEYRIEDFLKDLLTDSHFDYVAIQGEICSPKIQKNRHGLTRPHFFAFAIIDSDKGKWDIREVTKITKLYGIERVPIIDEEYILPDTIEELKKHAEGYYSPDVCECNPERRREGLVYYKSSNPNYSFKNISRNFYYIKEE